MPRTVPLTVTRILLVPGAILTVAMLLAVAVIATSEPIAPATPHAAAVTVRVTTVQPEPVRLSVAAQGSVNPAVQSELVVEVSGRVVEMAPALVAGGAFQAGEVLLRLDDRDQRATLERAGAALARASAEREHARFEHERLTALQGRDLASRSQLQNAQRLLRVAEAAHTEAEVAVDQAQRDLTRSALSAPFDGMVRSERVDLGQFVARGTAVATIYARDRVEVRLPVADRQLAYLDIDPGQRGLLPEDARPAVRLSGDYAGRTWTWQGTVTRTEAEIDTRTRMVTLVAEVSTGQQAPPPVGLFLQADIDGSRVDGVVRLPRVALRDGARVLVLDADNRLRVRQVSVLRFEGGDVLIDAGLAAGERVCTSPLQTFVEGMAVRPAAPGASAGNAAR